MKLKPQYEFTVKIVVNAENKKAAKKYIRNVTLSLKEKKHIPFATMDWTTKIKVL